ncbi:MAG: TadE/TadG family type IV pilus assembly protein [Pollutimonas bauzanensis]
MITQPQARSRRRQRGAAMIEFAVVGPVITVLGLAIVQYGHLFFTKNHINHATFMAARAGSTGHADLGKIQTAYIRAMIPVYGGGTSSAALAESYGKAAADIAVATRIELLNPTKESFDDWNDSKLQDSEGGGRRVIPNAGLAFRNPDEIRPDSGQNIQDANLIKIRVTHGYKPMTSLKFISGLYTRYLQWLDTGGDPFYSALVRQGRIPVVSHATVQMQSDAIEPDDPVSLPGPGNGGAPSDPGIPPGPTTPPPDCATASCLTPTTPLDPGGGGDPGGCTGGNCPPCEAAAKGG